MKLRNILFGLPLIIGIGCATTKIGGNIDLAYVPERQDDKLMKNELMVGLNVDIITDLGFSSLSVGGSQRTYMHLFEYKTFYGYPNRQEYEIYSKLDYKNLEFYLFHMCSHPINFQTNDEEFKTVRVGEDAYVLGMDGITKMGVRIKW